MSCSSAVVRPSAYQTELRLHRGRRRVGGAARASMKHGARHAAYSFLLSYAGSRSSKDGPFRLQDSIPFSMAAVDEYISLSPMVCPFVEVRVK